MGLILLLVNVPIVIDIGSCPEAVKKNLDDWMIDQPSPARYALPGAVWTASLGA